MSAKELAVAKVVTAVPAVQLGTLEATNPAGLLQSATAIATPLAELIQSRKLYTSLQGRKHVHVEGWTTLAMMLGCIPREASVTESDGIFTATVELVRMNDGTVISRASAECGSTDEKDRNGKPIWANRPRYARRSMAITRATGKVCRIALSWIMVMAGYDPTPAEEMQNDKLVIYDAQPIEPPIGAGSAAHRAIEARISELTLNRAGVKEWAKRYMGTEHFPDLSLTQQRQLMSELPRMAIKKLRKQIATADQQTLIESAKSLPSWLENDDREELMNTIDKRIIELETPDTPKHDSDDMREDSQNE